MSFYKQRVYLAKTTISFSMKNLKNNNIILVISPTQRKDQKWQKLFNSLSAITLYVPIALVYGV